MHAVCRVEWPCPLVQVLVQGAGCPTWASPLAVPPRRRVACRSGVPGARSTVRPTSLLKLASLCLCPPPRGAGPLRPPGGPASSMTGAARSPRTAPHEGVRAGVRADRGGAGHGRGAGRGGGASGRAARGLRPNQARPGIRSRAHCCRWRCLFCYPARPVDR